MLQRGVRGMFWAVLCATLALALPAAPAHAQDAPPDAAALAQEIQSEVRVELERFGVGKAPRPGDWAGIRLRLLDSAAQGRDVLVRLTIPDADGDRAVVQREITLNPGVWQSLWLYAALPASFGPNDVLPVQVFQALEAPEVPGGFRPGRLLGSFSLSLRGQQQVIDPTIGLIGVVGPRSMGLRQYAVRGPGGEPWAPIGHELTEIITGLTPAELPDRWFGLMPFDAIVWGAGDPSELRGERAEAIREYVRRGGKLIVVLPPVGQAWTNRAANELVDLLPAVEIRRREGVDLRPWAPMFMKAAVTAAPRPLPSDAVVHELTPVADALPGEAIRIFNSPDGACVVARRLVGAGSVTLIGIDLTHRALADTDALDADVFWHRILGRRGELRSSDQMAMLAQPPDSWQFGSRRSIAIDSMIQKEVSKSGRSFAGVMLGLVLFVVYWLVAGPLGYAALKQWNLTRHAWLAFVLAAAFFTAVAWTGATLLRPMSVRALHVTLLDHVYGQPVQRARAWMSVLIPSYGDSTIAVGEPGPEGPSLDNQNAVTSWEPHRLAMGDRLTFPDARPYVVDARRPNAITVPTRATVKQVQADWSSGPVWGMPRPVALTEGESATINPVPGSPGAARVSGVLQHDLPAPLTDLVIIVVDGQRDFRNVPRGVVRLGAELPALLARASIYRINDFEWLPGEPLDLALATSPGRASEDASAARYLRQLVEDVRRTDDVFSGGGPVASPEDITDAFIALSLFPQLEPPDLRSRAAQLPLIQRRAVHGYDLGQWFTQPCLIIIGQMGSRGTPAPSPVPISVDGRPVKTEGRTVVRWIYPLPDRPPRFPSAGEPADPDADPDAGPDPDADPAQPQPDPGL